MRILILISDPQDSCVFLFMLPAQTCHRAQEWLSVVSELTLRLNKGILQRCSTHTTA